MQITERPRFSQQLTHTAMAAAGMAVAIVIFAFCAEALASEVPLLDACKRVLRYLGVGALALGMAWIWVWRSRRRIGEPVAEANKVLHAIAASQDYAQRIPHERNDELGSMLDAVNALLVQIEGRGAALTLHRDELERQVSVRTEQLEKAKNAAEAASRAKSAFLATMSHEIRTPMNGVLGMTEMLLSTNLSDTQRSYTSMVQRSGEHLLVLINDILDFSKIEAGKLTVEYIHFNLADLLEDIDHVFTPQAQAKGLPLLFDIANDLPLAVCGDPNRLRQVLANLLGNAIKFTDRGQIQTSVRVADESAQSVSLRFEVQDTGIGVARGASSRIFEAFSQADNSTTRKYGGTGLGLAIAKQLVELMGGKIGVENALPQGSLFWFTVSFDKRRTDSGMPAARGAGLRALVVDENANNRAALELQLAGWNIRADTAADADEAMQRLRHGAYDIAVIDMDMRSSSGLALAAAIKADKLAPAMRILLLTNERCAADAQQRRSAGVAYQLIKPPRAGDLWECLLAPQLKAAPPPPSSQHTEAPPVAMPARREPPSASQRQRKILLAEDNPVNVEVAQAMLASLGLDVTCARNGNEALRAVEAGDFDVVLMDCHMPIMDGFAATAAIRRHEQEGGRKHPMPILAITANALQGDRETCLAAGMDDYLSKPFTRHDLAATISRWITLPRAPVAESPELAPEHINLHALENIRALSADHGNALVDRVINAYISDTPLQLGSLKQAIAARDPEQLRKAAHSLKSASANVGADLLAQLCRDMEQLGRNASTDGAGALLRDMEHQFQAVRHSLCALLEKET